MPARSATSSRAVSRAKVPSRYPGARKAESAPAFVTTRYDFVVRSRMSYNEFVGPVGSATHFPCPEFEYEMCSRPLMRPRFQPTRTC